MLQVLDLALEYEADTNRPLYTGKVIACIFFEPSTRTRLSFETAANRLGAVSSVFLHSMPPAFQKEKA